MSAFGKPDPVRMDKYLKTYSTVQAVAVQSDRPSCAYPRPINSSVSCDAFVDEATSSCARPARRVARADLGIRYDGRNYVYRGYRYDRLADAVNYAKLDRARSAEAAGERVDAAPFAVSRPPSNAERALMRELAITFRDGVYHLGSYRYDRLGDAIAWAKRSPPSVR